MLIYSSFLAESEKLEKWKNWGGSCRHKAGPGWAGPRQAWLAWPGRRREARQGRARPGQAAGVLPRRLESEKAGKVKKTGIAVAGGWEGRK